MDQTAVPDEVSPSLATLFLAFSGVALMGFGGVMPFARRMLVEQRRWLDSDAFNEAYALAQFLPGGNIINLSVVVGRRYRGALGALVSVIGLVAGPMLLMMALGAVYARYGEIPAVHNGLTGAAAAAAGLIISMAAKMAAPLVRKRVIVPAGVAVLAFLMVTLLELPLLAVVAVLAPLSVAMAWRSLS